MSYLRNQFSGECILMAISWFINLENMSNDNSLGTGQDFGKQRLILMLGMFA